MQVTSKCECCGAEFQAQRKSAKFCSDKCRIKNHRPSRRERYNRLVDEYNALVDQNNGNVHDLEEVIDNLNMVISKLLDIAGEPNKAKREKERNAISAKLMVSRWLEAHAQSVQRIARRAKEKKASDAETPSATGLA